MKKVYLLLSVGLLSGLLVNAQLSRSNGNEGKKKTKTTSAVARHSAPTTVNTPASVIWSNDFSNAADWVTSHAPGTTDDWSIGSVPPSGPFMIAPIATTGDFALFDSDLLCSHDQVAQLTNANPIDLTGHPNVRLSFNEFYERFHDSTYVYVSTNGTSWTRFEVNAGLSSNFFPGGSSANSPGPNPFPVTLDISSVAGNQATVYIRFEFYSPDTNAAGPDTLSGCAYAWMIDDVAISDIAATDASLMKADAGEYTWIPIIQPEAFQLRGRLINTGSTAINGGRIIFNVIDINGPLFSDTSAASGTLNSGDTSTFLLAPNVFVPPAVGFYTVEQLVYVSGDGDATNDTSRIDVLVNDSTYARDGASLGEAGVLGAFGFNGGSGSFGQLYHIWHASDLTSATFFLSNAPIGTNVSVELFSVTGGVPDISMGASAVYNLQPQDTGWITIPFNAPISVAAGDYCVVLNQLDTTNLSLVVADGVYTPQKNFFKAAAGNWTPLEQGGLEGALLLQVNNPSGTLLSAKQIVSNSQFNIYPNPSTGYIYLTGNQEKDVTVEVTNSVGQIVKSLKFDTLSINRIDLHGYPTGMYNIHIKSATGTVTKTVVLQ